MAALKDVLGVFLCLVPVVGVVAYMAWATRRMKCPHCQKTIRNTATSCDYCGKPITAQ